VILKNDAVINEKLGVFVVRVAQAGDMTLAARSVASNGCGSAILCKV
jgi:hypothetical protein